MTRNSPLLSQARRLFETPVPDVSSDEAARMAWEFYGLKGSVALLSGERDRNFLIRPESGPSWVLKFINDAEPDAEADMQAAALDHLAGEPDGVAVPLGRMTCLDERVFHATTTAGLPVRGRCYSYLAGDLALAHGLNDALRRSVGRTAARIAKALAGFHHASAARLNLWDLCNVGELAELAEELEPSAVSGMIGEFLRHFEMVTKPRLAGLRRQVIHNDLSRSNMLMEPGQPDRISGVLDFGDMIEAPLLCELAIAASYQLSGDDPLAALRMVVSGFAEVTPLEDLEYRLLLDFILARLIDRILISEWRARQFPENGAYILRSNREARDLMEKLVPVWRIADDRDWQAFFKKEL
ncbi:phosphotransferase [Telmatospirillum siberiense]|uniref:Hydroxylysine kinase n=1 Tax=Telmatospirillum siberiense TaxID=382514 RepID=A0A2N3PTP0_9PROT|nr:phosphotransferase [Telmatospirillum siberiense]PKU23756.1 hypothetical protein CWS72_14785 [Telmatospirillum siberiense]